MRFAVVSSLLVQALVVCVAAAPSAGSAGEPSTVATAILAQRASACTLNSQCTPTNATYCAPAATGTKVRFCSAKKADAQPCTGNDSCLKGLCQANARCESTNLPTAKKCLTAVSRSSMRSQPSACVLTVRRSSMQVNCASQICSSGLCRDRVANGANCTVAANCQSGFCSTSTKKCAIKPVSSSSSMRTSTIRSSSTTKASSTPAKPTSTPSPTPAAPGANCTATPGCAGAPGYRCISGKCIIAGAHGQRCYADGTCQSGKGLVCSSGNNTCIYAPPSPPPAAGPNQACTLQGGCLGDGAFRCLSGVCTAVGGYLERCTASGTCPKSGGLSCSSIDDVCRYSTPPQSGPGGSCQSDNGCLGDGAFRCIAGTCTSVGGFLERCSATKSCPKDSKLECSSLDDTCRFKPAPAGALQACRTDIGCADAAYTCSSGVCTLSGDLGQPCRIDKTCPSSQGLVCSSTGTCTYAVGQPNGFCTAQGGCAGAGSYLCVNSICIPAGGTLQPCRADGTCPGASNLYCASDKLCRNTQQATGPGEPCAAAGCLGDGAYRCLDSICKPVGGYLERCSAKGLCPKDSNLACSPSDNICRWITPPAVGPGGQCQSDAGCLGDGAFRCLSGICTAAGGLTERCRVDQTCPKSSAIECNTSTDTCVPKPAPAGTFQPCRQDIGCSDANSACSGGVCLPAGDNGQPCRNNGTCPSSPGLECLASTKMCAFKVGSPLGACTIQGGCSGAGAFTCIQGNCAPVGGLNQPCRGDRTCSFADSTLYCASDNLCRNKNLATGPGQPCTAAGCLGDGSYRCINAICLAVGGLNEPCRSDSTCPKDGNLSCDAGTNTCKYLNAPPSGPGGPCSADSNCLGDGAFRCISSTCQAAGGHLERCRSDSTCPKDSALYCAAADDTCHKRTSCDPECDPTTQGCLFQEAQGPNPARNFCVATSGLLGQVCIGDGQCAAGLKCSASNVCEATAPTGGSTTTPSSPATTCSPACDLSTQVCQSLTYNGGANTAYFCVDAGGPLAPCLNGGCTNDRYFCDADANFTCQKKPPTTCEPACATTEVCNQLGPVDFKCAPAGQLGLVPYVNGTCAIGLSLNATTQLCDLSPSGGSCSVDSTCQAGLRCLSAKCTNVGEPGQRCTVAQTCNDSGNAFCASNDFCVAYAGVGEACRNDSSCAASLRCKSNKCVATGGLRQACLRNQGGCTDAALACDAPQDLCLYKEPAPAAASCGQDEDCALGMQCLATGPAPASSVCTVVGSVGAGCFRNSTCAGSATCADGTCKKALVQNETCTIQDPCSDGFVCVQNKTVAIDTTSAPSTGTTEAPLLDRRVLAWRYLNERADEPPADPAPVSSTASPSFFCTKAGYADTPCFTNGSCSAVKGGGACNVSTNTCGQYFAKVNETCSDLSLNKTFDGFVDCDQGLRCISNKSIGLLPNGSYGFVDSSTCKPAGGLRQKCLNTTSGFTCNDGYVCSAQNAVGTCVSAYGGQCKSTSDCQASSICLAGTCKAAGNLTQPVSEPA